MDELIRKFNDARKSKKNEWLFFNGDIDGEPVTIKSYNTWIQVITYKNMRDSSPMDLSVGKMNEWLRSFFNDWKQE